MSVCVQGTSVRPVAQLKHVQCTEDDDFMTAFDKMMSETLQVVDVQMCRGLCMSLSLTATHCKPH